MATVTVTVTGADEILVTTIDCPCGDGTQALLVRGSGLDDKIDIKLGSMGSMAPQTIDVKIKVGSGSMGLGTLRFEDISADNISKVIAYGLDGNDDQSW